MGEFSPPFFWVRFSTDHSLKIQSIYFMKTSTGEGGSPRNVGRGCTAHFPKPLSYLWPKPAGCSLTCLWPGQKFDTKLIYDRCSWHSCSKHKFLLWRTFVKSFNDNDGKVASSKKQTQFKTGVLNSYPSAHTLFKTKMAKIDTLFMTKTSEKRYLLGSHIPI